MIHLHYFYPLIILVYLYKKIYPKSKAIVTFHGSDINEHINGGFNQTIFSFLARSIDYTIAVGDDLGNEITYKLKLKVNDIISAGVDEKVFFPMTLEKKYDFIFVGSFIKRKGIDMLIDAIQIVGNKKTRYCIVGSGIFEKNILMLKDYDITILKNQNQQKLCELYNQSKYFILPSRDEPFGLVATESIFVEHQLLFQI